MRSPFPVFFQFTSIHSLLVGMLPFFIPVLLWRSGYSFSEMNLFIVFTAVGFLLTLSVWQTLHIKQNWRAMVIIPLVAEALLILSLVVIDSPQNPLHVQGHSPNRGFLLVVALLNGGYNCFYWTTQRVMFNQLSNASGNSVTTGRDFGNFQILVIIALKLGILLGASLLESGESVALLSASLLISVAGGAILLIQGKKFQEGLCSPNPSHSRAPQVSLVQSLRFKDKHRSAGIFYLDGVFLFLESYFWVLTLYFISQESVLKLGYLIIGLTVLLSVIFYLIKNQIDRVSVRHAFILGVLLYASGWLLRALVGMNNGDQSAGPPPSIDPNYLLLLLIAFNTSFFRLTFNKRFYEHANVHAEHTLRYLLVKSYLSQSAIVVFFAALALIEFTSLVDPDLSSQLNSNAVMSYTYLLVAPLALLFLRYKEPKMEH